MGYHKPIDPQIIWEYAIRELTSAKNITSNNNVVDQSVWEYATRELTSLSNLFSFTDVDPYQHYVIPKGLHYAILKNRYNGSNTVSLQVNDNGTWKTFKQISLADDEVKEVGMLISDGENLKFYSYRIYSVFLFTLG